MRYFEGEDAIAEARREDMENDALEWRRNEERERMPKCVECRFFTKVGTEVRGGGELLDVEYVDAVPLCMVPGEWPAYVHDARQEACEDFEPCR